MDALGQVWPILVAVSIVLVGVLLAATCFACRSKSPGVSASPSAQDVSAPSSTGPMQMPCRRCERLLQGAYIFLLEFIFLCTDF